MLGVVARRRHRDDDHDNPAWPGLVDLFAFGMVVMLLLWVQALPKPSRIEPAGSTDLPPQPPDRWKPIMEGWPGYKPDRHGERLRISRFPEREIYFKSGRWDLGEGDLQSLREVARNLNERLAAFPDVSVIVNGTADPKLLVSPTPPRDNIELSALRAAEVSRALVAGGLKRRLSIVGLGEQDAGPDMSEKGLEKLRQVYLELERPAPPVTTTK